jgi:hypothetical protein
MRVLIWHVHGGYTNAFVAGRHRYLLPVNSRRDSWGLGTAGWNWPHAEDATAHDLRDEPPDVVVLQRPAEVELVRELTGMRPGRDLPAVYLEHNTPGPDVVGTTHPLADQDVIPIVHVTSFNRLYWDNARARTLVVEHGIPDPGEHYTGELDRIGVVINEPVRRWRATGTDLLPAFAAEAPVDVFGMGGDELAVLPGFADRGVHHGGDLPPDRLAVELARRRVYVHPYRWTSLGLALLEAMHLGMPVVAIPGPEVARAVPRGVGVVDADIDVLRHAIAGYSADADFALEMGRRARRHALANYGHGRFLQSWDDVLYDVVSDRTRSRKRLLGANERRIR